MSCRWGGGFLSNSQVLKTDVHVAVLTSGCDLRPWPLLDIINTKVLSFPQNSRVDVIYSCQWKKNDTLKALKNYVNNIFYTDCQTNSTLSKMKWTVEYNQQHSNCSDFSLMVVQQILFVVSHLRLILKTNVNSKKCTCWKPLFFLVRGFVKDYCFNQYCFILSVPLMRRHFGNEIFYHYIS